MASKYLTPTKGFQRGRESLFSDNTSASRNSSVEAGAMDGVASGVGSAEREEKLKELKEMCEDRYEKTERLLRRYFGNDRPCCANGDDGDWSDDDKMDMDGMPNGVTEEAAPKLPPTRKGEDDDYDDEDDEMTDAPPVPAPAAPPSLPPPAQPAQPARTESDSKITDAKKNAVESRAKLEADTKAREEVVTKGMQELFFTLENDHDAMLEQQKLEESDRQVNAETSSNGVRSTPGPSAPGAPGKLSSTNLGASSLTLKHLIARIDASRERVAMSDTELRNLMSEVRRNRSKWASEDKIGQEDLYEAAEKVVLDLRSKTEHSTAFLNRVNKREAPHYFEIIKNPMDLGTVMKKLKNLQYKSKAEFVNDLNLIWDNCLKYNSDPSHYLRKHALAMKEATSKLVELIPDITIRDRADVEAEEAADAESDDEPIMSSRSRKAPGAKKARKARSDPKTEGTPEAKPPVVNIIRSESVPPGAGDALSQAGGSQLGDASSQTGLPTPPISSNTPNGISDEPMDKPDEYVESDPVLAAWKTMTKMTRATAAKKRAELFSGVSINEDQPALIRTRSGMSRYIRNASRHNNGEPEETGMEALSAENDSEKDERSRNGLYLPEYDDPMCAVPELPWRLEWKGGEEEVDVLEDYARPAPKGIFTAPKSGLDSKMAANMKQMQETRKLCSKISVIKQMQMQTQIYANQFTKYEPEEFKEQEADEFLVTEDGPIMHKVVARAALQRSIGRMLYHSGFEDYQPTALDVITDIAADYFQKIAKTFKLYSESPQQFTQEEVLFHTLHENGIDSESLDSYIRDDVERLGTKLKVIHERMKAHLTDMLRPAFADGQGEQAFNDGSEQFIGGDFAEELGEDFFGFKELGLDKEFGLSGLGVPLHLLQGRINSYQNAHIGAAAQNADGQFKSPPPFEPLTRDLLEKQIGIIKPFFYEKLAHLPQDASLLEDEDLPQKQRPPKPRLPPTGKISQPRKRPSNSAAGNAKKKKKPNPPAQEKGAAGAKKGSQGTADGEEGTYGKGFVGEGGMISPESITAG